MGSGLGFHSTRAFETVPVCRLASYMSLLEPLALLLVQQSCQQDAQTAVDGASQPRYSYFAEF